MDPLTLALIMGGSQIAGGLAGGLGSYLSSRDQLRAADRAQRAMTGQYQQALGYQQPYYQAGQTGLGQLMSGDYNVAVPQYQQTEPMPGPYQAEQFKYQEDPGMAYRMQTGQRALETSAAGRGAGLSGATMKALAKYGQELGSQEYGNAWNRYMQGRQQGLGEYQTNLGRSRDIRDFGYQSMLDKYKMQQEQALGRYGRASDLAGYGERAGTRMSDLATGYGQNLASLYGQRGQAQAAGTMGMAQAAGTGLGNIGQSFLTPYYLSGNITGMTEAPKLGQKK